VLGLFDAKGAQLVGRPLLKKSFKRSIDSLNGVFDFVGEFIETNKISEDFTFAINLAIEEVFTNLVKYNADHGGDVSVCLDLENDAVIMQLTDFDVEPFDITKRYKFDPNQSLEERQIGGIGLHLVRNLVDKITYEYRKGDRCACITMVKQLEDSDVV